MLYNNIIVNCLKLILITSNGNFNYSYNNITQILIIHNLKV